MKLALHALAVLLLPAFAQAGTKVGNGGGGWICREQSTYDVRWLVSVDLFEARAEFGLRIPKVSELNEWEILRQKVAFIRAEVPELSLLIERDVHAFLERVIVLPDGSDLTKIDDGEIRVKPSPTSCVAGYLYYAQIANYTNDGRLLINGELWNEPKFSNTDRGALLLHELVYKAMRERGGDLTSARSRRIVGLLFSDLPPQKIRAAISPMLPNEGGKGGGRGGTGS